MEPFCTCGHDATAHAHRAGRCTGLDSYGLPCACPSLEPDLNTVAVDVDAAREEALITGQPVPPRWLYQSANGHESAQHPALAGSCPVTTSANSSSAWA